MASGRCRASSVRGSSLSNPCANASADLRGEDAKRPGRTREPGSSCWAGAGGVSLGRSIGWRRVDPSKMYRNSSVEPSSFGDAIASRSCHLTTDSMPAAAHAARNCCILTRPIREVAFAIGIDLGDQLLGSSSDRRDVAFGVHPRPQHLPQWRGEAVRDEGRRSEVRAGGGLQRNMRTLLTPTPAYPE
jgi:hypothetical protein